MKRPAAILMLGVAVAGCGGAGTSEGTAAHVADEKEIRDIIGTLVNPLRGDPKRQECIDPRLAAPLAQLTFRPAPAGWTRSEYFIAGKVRVPEEEARSIDRSLDVAQSISLPKEGKPIAPYIDRRVGTGTSGGCYEIDLQYSLPVVVGNLAFVTVEMECGDECRGTAVQGLRRDGQRWRPELLKILSMQLPAENVSYGVQ